MKKKKVETIALPKPVIKFGTDGWRGIIGKDYTFDNVRYVAHAVAEVFEKKGGEKPKVFVGYDHRFQADKFAEVAASALSTHNFRPCLLPHAVSSPLLSFVTWKEKSPFGVMMTASHNPAEYLGFKVKSRFGGSIPQEVALKIEASLAKVLSKALIYGAPDGKKAVQMAGSPLPDYYNYVKKHFDIPLLKKSRMAVTFDVMFGPGGKITQGFFDSIGSRLSLQIIHNTRDALFGGLHPEPIEKYLSDLKETVRKSKSAGGFALDGDADRLGLVDDCGRYLTPPQVFPLMLYYLAREKGLKGKVVQAVSLGYLSQRIAQDFGLPFEEVPVGFKNVAERILKEDVILGGEESGGYAFSRTDRNSPVGAVLPERDGLLSALLVLEMILSTGKNISRFLADLQKRYGNSFFLRNDIILSRPVQDKSEFVRRMQNCLPAKWMGFKIKEMKTLDGLKIVMEDGSWLLMRPSGTEPLLRTYGEFPTLNLIKKSLLKLEKIVRDVLKK